MYIVYKSNDRVNLPALDGRLGAPHPCMVSGARWTYAWPSIAPLLGDAGGDIRYADEQVVICDNFHQYQASKSQNVKMALGWLRTPWIGFQIYLKGGVRLIQEAPDSVGNLATIQHLISHQQKYPIAYVEDAIAPSSEPDAIPTAPCAHRDLPYGAVTDGHFYEKLREARRLGRSAKREEKRSLRISYSKGQ